MAWRHEARLMVVVHGPVSPTSLEWSRYLNDLRNRTAPDLRALVYTHGGGPDGPQRAQLAELFKARPMMVAVLTRSAVMRAVGAAVAWFNRDLKVFGYDAHAEAFAHLGLSPAEREHASELRQQLERELGLSSSVLAS